MHKGIVKNIYHKYVPLQKLDIILQNISPLDYDIKQLFSYLAKRRHFINKLGIWLSVSLIGQDIEDLKEFYIGFKMLVKSKNLTKLYLPLDNNEIGANVGFIRLFSQALK